MKDKKDREIAFLKRKLGAAIIELAAANEKIHFLESFKVWTLLAETRAELKDLEATFDLRWKADVRATKMWRKAHPGKELTLPDHADLVVWLMQEITKKH